MNQSSPAVWWRGKREFIVFFPLLDRCEHRQDEKANTKSNMSLTCWTDGLSGARPNEILSLIDVVCFSFFNRHTSEDCSALSSQGYSVASVARIRVSYG